MIRKYCNVEGCDRPLYARGFCHYHYKTEYLAKKPKKKKIYNIPKATNKRAKEQVEYAMKRKLFIEGQRDKHGHIYCIFCGRQITGEPDLHHAFGRDNDLLLDVTKWFLAHNYCHVQQYHSKSHEDIWWWKEYMYRIRYNKELLNKEQLRMSKT